MFSFLPAISIVHVVIGYIIIRWKVAIALLGNSYLHLTIISCTHFPFFWASFVVQYSLSVSIVVSTQLKCKDTVTSTWEWWVLQRDYTTPIACKTWIKTTHRRILGLIILIIVGRLCLIMQMLHYYFLSQGSCFSTDFALGKVCEIFLQSLITTSYS